MKETFKDLPPELVDLLKAVLKWNCHQV
jgi:hypothetical protein